MPLRFVLDMIATSFTVLKLAERFLCEREKESDGLIVLQNDGRRLRLKRQGLAPI
jgi:hypothetical protein